MKNARAQWFRVAVLVSGALLVLSWFMPWWAARVQELRGQDHVVIHPWGLQVNSPRILTYLPPEADLSMPTWFAPAMWAYLVLVIAALLLSLFVKDVRFRAWKVRITLPSLLIGLVGLSYLITVITAAAVTSIRLASAGMPLMGRIVVTVGSDIGTGIVYSGIQLGAVVAAVAGLLLVMIAFLRSRILGTKAPSGSAAGVQERGVRMTA